LAVVLLTACRREPIDIDATLDAGDRYLHERDYEMALIQFMKVINADPKNIDAYYGAADAYLGMDADDQMFGRKIEGAKAVLRRGVKETGDSGLAGRLAILEREEEMGLR
jgi:tetratricopeptide (TPR) repeat protein